MAVVVVTPPAEEPITLAEAKAHVRADGTYDDALITSLIVTARVTCEKLQNRAYVTQTLRLSLDAFPKDSVRAIEIHRPPLQSVTSITYKDVTGVVKTLDTSTYAVDSDSYVGRVALMPNANWPTFSPWPVNAVSITYVAGYGLAASVPRTVKQAMLLLIGHWYENRESVITGTISKEIEFSVTTLLALDHVYW